MSNDNELNIIGNVMLISTQEGVLSRGVKRKLKDYGIECCFVGTDADAVEDFRDKTDVYIIILNENISGLRSCLTSLKSIVDRMDKVVIVIGSKFEKAELRKAYPTLLVSAWYDKEVDMKGLTRYVDESLKKSALSEMDKTMKKNILIVDDDPSYARMIRTWLKEYYHVSLVTSGMQAIKYLLANSADLVFLDYDMPVTTGPQVFEMLKSEPGTEDVPIVFLTGIGDKESVMQVMSLKPDGYILKTATREDLLEYVKDFFKKQMYTEP